MKKALILGCSHSVGAEMRDEPGLRFDNSIHALDYYLAHCYPAQIAQALGYMPINRSISGGSNDAMFRLFLEETLTPNDIVIACWTGVNRSEVYDETWLQLCPGAAVPKEIAPDYFKQWLLYSGNTEVGMLLIRSTVQVLLATCRQRRQTTYELRIFLLTHVLRQRDQTVLVREQSRHLYPCFIIREF